MSRVSVTTAVKEPVTLFSWFSSSQTDIRISIDPEPNMAESFTRQTRIVPMLFPEADWNAVVSAGQHRIRFLRTTCFSTWQSHSVRLCGLPLRG